MKYKLISLLLSVTLIIAGCGSKTTSVDLTEVPSSEESTISETEEESESIEESKEVFLDKDVELIMTMYNFDESTVEEYIEKLKTENPEKVYGIYDDSHYTITIKESERKKVLEEMSNGKYINDAFKEFFSDEQYNGAFLEMEYEELFQNVTFYVDKEAFDNAGLMVTLGPLMSGGMFADIVQTYNLIKPEDRTCTVRMIDNETNEVIYDSSQEQSAE